MQTAPITKYVRPERISLPGRKWPDRQIETTPIWCSVDLRDGNQAISRPMSVEEKLEYFEMLVKIRFKEIEVGFPSASQTEFEFCRRLIEENRIPAGTTIQILCQCREDLISRSLDAIAGAPSSIFHLYNSTSPKQREYVFNAGKDAITELATNAVSFLKKEISSRGISGVRLEYSPESFNSTEMEFARDICNAVIAVWDAPIIINLPATVEYSTPNTYADQIEWMSSQLNSRENVVLSVHTHNDRGTGVAATELALLAGAQRVEGTLFGIGERTGNLDIVTTALNLYTHGIDPQLDFSNMPAIQEVYERCTGMEMPSRQPYAGELAFTAFSGSHQDAIKKSLARQGPEKPWDILYIPLDPADVGRSYEKVVRINSQSGKGGVAYVLEKDFGLQIPKFFQKELGCIVNELSDSKGEELSAQDVYAAFQTEFVDLSEPIKLVSFSTVEKGSAVACKATIRYGVKLVLRGAGNGPIAAFVDALGEAPIPKFEVTNYSEHSVGSGSGTEAVSYIEIKCAAGIVFYGAGRDTNIEMASIKAVLSALNRKLRR